jgi:hypothetical protein
MSIPVDVHLEVQYATSNRAKCKVCGQTAAKDSVVIKILGFRINHTIHPECIGRLVNILGSSGKIQGHAPVLRSSGDGIIKVGIYEKTDTGYRWKTAVKVDVKGGTNEPEQK